MCKMNKKDKEQLLDIFGGPNIKIELCDYKDYCQKNISYYKVVNAKSEPLVDISVTPIMRGIERYQIIWPNKKQISRLVRPNAVFRRPMAADIMEVYNWLQLRLLLQQSSKKQTK